MNFGSFKKSKLFGFFEKKASWELYNFMTVTISLIITFWEMIHQDFRPVRIHPINSQISVWLNLTLNFISCKYFWIFELSIQFVNWEDHYSVGLTPGKKIIVQNIRMKNISPSQAPLKHPSERSPAASHCRHISAWCC